MSFLIFSALADSSSSFALARKASSPPRWSTVRSAAEEMRSWQEPIPGDVTLLAMPCFHISGTGTGIGTLVDADMEETSARLQALQVQQQLSTQALSIANQAPQNLLALFRG